MKLTAQTDQFAIYDDVLPPEEFESLYAYLSIENYSSLLLGEGCYGDVAGSAISLSADFDPKKPEVRLPNAANVNEEVWSRFPVYPTERPIDYLYEAIEDLVDEHRDLVGVKGMDWRRFSLAAQSYADASGLRWHTDFAYAGHALFYAHPVWQANWGGELLIAPEQTGTEVKNGSALEAELITGGLGAFVMPRPNRLVLLRECVPHKVAITRMPDHAQRICILGFFLKLLDAEVAEASA